MRQVLQNIRSGNLTVDQIPAPAVADGEVLIANQASLVSAGTEKMVMDLAKKSLLGKARERPDQVRRVLEKIRNEGLRNTFRQVRQKLDEPMTMGYSSAGIVLACGAGVQHFKPGDRVASNGPHAEIVSVAKNLCAHVADNVPFEQACFAVLGSIALQGVRLAQCELGETVFVIGLGLVGQLTVALAKAAGLVVIGTDLDESKCTLARQMGADFAEPGLGASRVEAITSGLGADAVIITASTKSNVPIEIAAHAVRKKGRVVLVGVVGLEIDRRPFYFKEAEFVVSCSYGPGRYDPSYEEHGHDYPAAWVRWTQQRNIQSVLDLMHRRQLNVGPLISHRFSIDDATNAYEMINTGSQPFLGVVIQYPELATSDIVLADREPRSISLPDRPPVTGRIRCGVLGAGNFARMVMLPAIDKSGLFEPVMICSGKGVTAHHAGTTSGFASATTNEDQIFDDDSINTIFSLTRHDQHARHVITAIQRGRNIFVEKPLCLTLEELQQIEAAIDAAGDRAPAIMVGFNRRFSPAAVKLRNFFSSVSTPLTISIRFNAGELPADHWTQNDEVGGGRIIGEACHAIDLATYLAGSVPIRVFAESVAVKDPHQISDDQCFITLRHANGSVSSIGYVAGGDKACPKERVEVFGGGQVGVIDDFRSVQTCRGGRTKTESFAQDKGHSAEVTAFAKAIAAGSGSPIAWEQIVATTLASIGAVRSLREGIPISFSAAGHRSNDETEKNDSLQVVNDSQQ
ncbi:MAG: bi-domain-containing oxidoreductase [Planctomycetaceae bacterium]